MKKNNTPLETDLLIAMLHKEEWTYTPIPISEETKIFNNYSKAVNGIIGSWLGIFFSLLMYFPTHNDVGKFAWLCIFIFSICYLITSIIYKNDTAAQITINRQGITIKGRELIPWDTIEDERVEYRPTGKLGIGREYYLRIELIESLSNTIVVSIEKFNISPQELFNILKTYHKEYTENLHHASVKNRSIEL